MCPQCGPKEHYSPTKILRRLPYMDFARDLKKHVGFAWAYKNNIKSILKLKIMEFLRKQFATKSRNLRDRAHPCTTGPALVTFFSFF